MNKVSDFGAEGSEFDAGRGRRHRRRFNRNLLNAWLSLGIVRTRNSSRMVRTLGYWYVVFPCMGVFRDGTGSGQYKRLNCPLYYAMHACP